MARLEPEMIMVNAASKALELRSRRPRTDADEAIKQIIRSGEFRSDDQIYAVVAINEILKIKTGNPGFSDKQIMQEFVDNVYHILAKVKEY